MTTNTHEKRLHYQQMITKHLAAGNEDWVSNYNARLAKLNLKERKYGQRKKGLSE